ncbi:MAG: response regulator [Proteobacteria bacterium]|nr:response regulator [Pseudomonadota bacterium]
MQEYKILVVDDETDFVQSLTDRLEMRKMKADVAFNGEDALQKIADDEPEVMVLDLKMPGMDGLEVLQRVKNAYPTTQVIILTGHGSDDSREKARKMGAYAYLEKPVEMDTLMATIGKAYGNFKKIKRNVDTALMGAALSAAGEPEMARQVMAEEFIKD